MGLIFVAGFTTGAGLVSWPLCPEIEKSRDAKRIEHLDKP